MKLFFEILFDMSVKVYFAVTNNDAHIVEYTPSRFDNRYKSSTNRRTH